MNGGVGRESEFSRNLALDLRNIGASVLVVHGHQFQAAGWPDLQVYHRTWTGHLELKVNQNKVDDLQRIVMNKLRFHGSSVYVLRLIAFHVRIETPDGAVLTTLQYPLKPLEFLQCLARHDAEVN